MLLVGLGTEGFGSGLHAEQARAPQTAVPCVACQALSVLPGQAGVLPRDLNGTRVLIRLAPGSAGSSTAARLLADLRARGGRTGIHLTGIPDDSDPALALDFDALVIEAPDGDPDRVAFDVKRALASARGRRPAATLLVAAAPGVEAALRARGVEPYLSGFIAPPAPIATSDELVARIPHGSMHVRVLSVVPAEAADIAQAAAALQAWFPEGLVPVRARALTCGEDRRIPAFLNPRTLDLVAATSSCAAPATVTSDMPGATVERHDLGGVSAFLVHAGSDRFAEGVDVAAPRTLSVDEIIARHQAAAARQAAAIVTDIATGTLTLTFEAPGFVAPITVTSETTIYQGPRTQGPRTQGPRTQGPRDQGPRDQGPRDQGPRDQGPTDIRQRNIRVNGVLFRANGGVPRLPIIEPERAAAPPLAITLTDVYRYRLVGRERLRGYDTYVVAFAPRGGGESLYEGRAWIDAASFGMVRVAATQTRLTGPITASEQTDDFAPDADGHWLLARSDVRQTYEGASVRTPIHRLLVIDQHAVNRADFAAERAAAYASDDVMLRDTPEGYRYLAKVRRQKADEGGTTATEATADAVRIVAGRAERIRTFAFGVIVDPNISVPLPFAGLSYVDFNLFGTGTQFSGFFGGSYGQLAFSAPSVRGTRWQLAGRAFGIASSYNDRAFEQGREQYALDIRQRPVQAAVWLLRPLSARAALRIEYDWDYNRFGRGEATAPAFVVPRNQNAHAIRIGLEAQRAGWQGSVWGSYARRIGWRAWGVPLSSAFSPAHADFEKFGASLLRSGAVTARLTTRVEAAVMGGRDLDRFSRYAFGTFDNRLHGYPSALIRYDRGGVIRTAVAWSAFGALRIDGFADTAAVRDPGFGRGLRRYSGVGGALEAPGPFRTLLSLEWGYGFEGIDTDGRRGTQVVRLSGYKVF